MFFTYIIYSNSIDKYYTGQSQSIGKRLQDHNSNNGHFTSKGAPWIMVKYFTFHSRKDACALEKIIKKRGAARFLTDLKQGKYHQLIRAQCND